MVIKIKSFQETILKGIVNLNPKHLFIDFKTAHDSIIREELYSPLREFNIPEKVKIS